MFRAASWLIDPPWARKPSRKPRQSDDSPARFLSPHAPRLQRRVVSAAS